MLPSRTVQATLATLAGTPQARQLSAAVTPRVRAFQCTRSRAAVCPRRCHLPSRAQHGSCTYFTGSPRRAEYGKVTRTIHDRSASVAVAAQHSGHASASAIPRILSPQQARAQLLQSTTLESFKIAGVTFEDRQELVRQLKADQAVMMVKEADNMYDPNATAVQTLNGQVLGYVPKENTARFLYDITFGHVYSFGPNALGLWGVTVAVRPSVPPLTVDAFPMNLASHVSLSSNLENQQWNAIKAATFAKANHRCEVSGSMGAAGPLECHEVWRFHDNSATLQLLGFAAVHPGVHLAKHLECQQGDQQRQQAIWMLQSMNQWTVSEAEEYQKHARQLALNRSGQQWQFDLSWLPNNGFSIPAQLQPLCRV